MKHDITSSNLSVKSVLGRPQNCRTTTSYAKMANNVYALIGSLMLVIMIAGFSLLGQSLLGTEQTVLAEENINAVPQQSIGIQQTESYIVIFKDQQATDSGISIEDYATMLVNIYEGELLYIYEEVLEGFAANITAEAASEIASLPDVEEVVENQEISLDYVAGIMPEETQPSATWGLDRVDQRSLPLNSSYQYKTGAPDVHVYVIDTGIRSTHQEFGGRVGRGYSSIQDSSGTEDCHGHGTHVAGTIGGKTYGVAKEAKLYPIRVLSCSGRGNTASVLAGIEWVTANHQKPAVANMSLGGSVQPVLDKAVERSINAGVTYVVAAGNNNGNACNKSPARADKAITVGATANSDARANFSNHGECVDVFAPGHNITAAWMGNDTDTKTISGTSMAAPHVAGAAALYLQSKPDHTPETVFKAVLDVATPNKLSDINTGSPNLLLYTLFGDNPPNTPVPTTPPPTAVPTTMPTTAPTTGPTTMPTTAPTVAPTPAPQDTILYIDGSPISMNVGDTATLSFKINAGGSQVNGMQINGKLDPRYLKILDVQRNTDKFSSVLDPVKFDANSGTFQYGAGTLSGSVNGDFEVMRVQVEALAETNGTPIEFLNSFPPTNISGPSGSVMREARDGVVKIDGNTGSTFEGEVKLQGRPTGSDDSKAVPLIVRLYQAGGSSPIKSYEVTTDRDARFKINDTIDPGTYDIRIHNSHTLVSRVKNVPITNGSNKHFLGPLMEGDAVWNNEVVIEDFGPFSAAFNKCEGNGSGFDGRADFNEDNCINIKDFALISGNFNKPGDLEYDFNNIPTLPLEQAIATIGFESPIYEARIGQEIALPFYVDPNGTNVNGVTVNLDYDSDVLEIVNVDLGNELSTVLMAPTIDSTAGTLQFSAGEIGAVYNERFQLATITVRLLQETFGTSLRFERNDNEVDSTEITGEQGSVFGSQEGIVIFSGGDTFETNPCDGVIGVSNPDDCESDGMPTPTPTQNKVYLPIVTR